MRNGYFQLVSTPGGGYGIKIFPPDENGEPVRMGELCAYLDARQIPYEIAHLKQFLEAGKEMVCPLGRGECPQVEESYQLEISADCMQATARFYAPSQTGKRLTFNEFLSDLRYRKIVSGIQIENLQDHFQSPGLYCTDLIVAVGKEARHGTDARIEYFFNTNLHTQPDLKEDGSVDYYHLNMVNHCKKGDLLARIVPADEGEYGQNILGNRLKPREVKKASLKYSNHVELSEDKMSIYAGVDGHVMLVEGKVFVSDILEVENVDFSTGNIEFNGSVQVNGNVSAGFSVVAGGNIIVNGVVEGAYLSAGGNIIIARGINGMGKGDLCAGGNVITKFIESAKVVAENGYVNTESILHSEVSAGDEIIVEGKKGFVTGGHVQAAHRVRVKTLGAELGAATIVEVGVNPKYKEQYIELQKEAAELMKTLRADQPIVASFVQKKSSGVRITQDQVDYVRGVAKRIEENKQRLIEVNNQMTDFHQIFEQQKNATVEVTGEVYAGTTIVIGELSMILQSSYKYCKFERVQGEVKVVPL